MGNGLSVSGRVLRPASLPSGEFVIYHPGAWRWLSRAGAWTPLHEEAERFPSYQAADDRKQALRAELRRRTYVVEARRS